MGITRLTAAAALLLLAATQDNAQAQAVHVAGATPAYHGHAAHPFGQPGGYAGRVGAPYYYSAPLPQPGCGVNQVAPAHGHHAPVHRHHATGHMHQGYGYRVGYGAMAGSVYDRHFGPGYYRYAEHGHVRFPYYSYRRPWYFQGPPVFNRDTNFAW